MIASFPLTASPEHERRPAEAEDRLGELDLADAGHTAAGEGGQQRESVDDSEDDEREPVAALRASPVTVQRVIARLAAEGIVEPRPGRGTFVAAPARAADAADLSWQEVALAGPALDTGGLDELLALARPGAIVLSTATWSPGCSPSPRWAPRSRAPRGGPAPGTVCPSRACPSCAHGSPAPPAAACPDTTS